MTTSGKKRGKSEQPTETITAWKGFTKDLTCMGGGSPFQFKVGETYVHKGSVAACSSGFHACENPLDVWSYYGMENGNRFCRVQLSGKLDRHEGDSKIAAEKLTVETEVTLGEMIRAGVEYTVKATKGCGDEPSGNYAQIGSSGDSARIGSSGNSARIGSSGNYAQIGSSGNYAQIGSSGDSARIGSSGNSAQIGSSGDSGVIASAGMNTQAKGSEGTWIALPEFVWSAEKGRYLCCGFATGCIGQDGLKADTYYRAENGKLVEAA